MIKIARRFHENPDSHLFYTPGAIPDPMESCAAGEVIEVSSEEYSSIYQEFLRQLDALLLDRHEQKNMVVVMSLEDYRKVWGYLNGYDKNNVQAVLRPTDPEKAWGVKIVVDPSLSAGVMKVFGEPKRVWAKDFWRRKRLEPFKLHVEQQKATTSAPKKGYTAYIIDGDTHQLIGTLTGLTVKMTSAEAHRIAHWFGKKRALGWSNQAVEGKDYTTIIVSDTE